jgi:acetyl esterase/lipase
MGSSGLLVVLVAALAFTGCTDEGGDGGDGGMGGDGGTGGDGGAGGQAEMFTVYLDETPANGTFTTDPALDPAGTLLAPGTVIAVTPTPDPNYLVDSVYRAVDGPFTMFTGVPDFLDHIVPPYEVTASVDDMTVGAYFIEQSVVAGVKDTQNIEYAKPGNKSLKYDVFEPEAAHSDLPAVVIIHGGGWVANNEDIMRGLGRELAKTGRYVAFSMTYRLAGDADGDDPPTTMAEIINDVFGGIHHIMQNAALYGADASKLAVTGDSAGGHLAAVVATLSDKIGTGGFVEGVWEFWPTGVAEGDVAGFKADLQAAVKAVEPSYGVFDDVDDFDPDHEWNEHVSPIDNIPDSSVRVLPPQHLTRGSADPLITAASVQAYADALTAAGQVSSIDTIDGASHAYLDWKPHDGTVATFNTFGMTGIGLMIDFYDSVFYP